MLVSSPALLIGKEVQTSDVKVVTTKKIRVYPKNSKMYFQALHLHRRAYNLTIERFKKEEKPSTELRTEIRIQCREEQVEVNQFFNVNLVHEAYREACTSRTAVIRKRVQNEKAELHFKSWKYSPRSFLIDKLGSQGNVYKKALGGVFYTELIPDEAIRKQATIMYQNGQWFVGVQEKKELASHSKEPARIVAIDPGVRTFATSYSQESVIDYGKDFTKDILAPLMKKLDNLLSQRDLLNNTKLEDNQVPQWLKDRIRNLNKKIDFVRAKQSHLVRDLHLRVAFDLVKNNDVILLPTFETSKMVIKKDDPNRKRKIRSKTVRAMLSLGHFKFKLMIKWLAKKYGKIVIDVNEAHTSKTLWDGAVLPDLGGDKFIRHEGKIVGRDVNGARNILIRFLTKFVRPELFLIPN
ncbi:MAG: putative transposase [bacterium]